ncbi:MAG TPA: hypothetical protein VGN00_13245 [Puia sp.]|jgi:hypothetical protein
MNPFRIGLKSAPGATLLVITCTALLCITLSATSYAQSAREIVAKHIQALGGKERLQSINSIFVEGVAVMDNGTQVDAKVWKVYDRLFRQEISMGDSSVTTIVTPGHGWVANQQTNGTFKSMASDRLRALQPQIDPAGPLADYAAKGCRVDFVGRDSVRGIACYKIRLSCPMGQSAIYYIDAQTYYIVRETGKGGMMCVILDNNANPDGDFVIDFSDYKKTPEGYVFPYTIVTNAFGAKMSIDKVEINHNVDVEVLSRPRQAPSQAKRSNNNMSPATATATTAAGI